MVMVLPNLAKRPDQTGLPNTRPNSAQRATNVAEDPFSSTKYFHFVVKCVLEILFRITKHSNGWIDRKEGIFGKVQNYVGTVEAQGRGTLHLHMLL